MGRDRKKNVVQHLEAVENRDSREQLQRYVDEKRASGVKWNTLAQVTHTLHQLANSNPNAALWGFDRGDVVAWLKEATDRYADTTLTRMKSNVKDFFKVLNPEGDEFPDQIKWLTVGSSTKRKDPGAILSKDDVKAMIEAAANPRDKAIIAALYESGARLSEFLSLNIQNVELDQHGAVVRLNPDGVLKTGTRPIRLIFSTPYLEEWLRNHPDGDDPDAPLWISLAPRNRHGRLSDRSLYHIVEKHADLAEIGKDVYPHLFRHSRTTHLAKEGLSEMALRTVMGWSPGSEQPATYIRMSQADVEDQLLRLHGIDVNGEEEEEEQDPLEPWNCPRCDHRNPADADFCGKCTLARTLEAAESLEAAEDTAEQEQIESDVVTREELMAEMEEMQQEIEELRNEAGWGKRKPPEI